MCELAHRVYKINYHARQVLEAGFRTADAAADTDCMAKFTILKSLTSLAICTAIDTVTAAGTTCSIAEYRSRTKQLLYQNLNALEGLQVHDREAQSLHDATKLRCQVFFRQIDIATMTRKKYFCATAPLQQIPKTNFDLVYGVDRMWYLHTLVQTVESIGKEEVFVINTGTSED